ncbi:DUF7344 domain-containing protein [Halovivax limisalsi]|uniref:DUF7344 domain-containing protein n=1 Tax=Halovivax limisalsi TaxID=1453760 RepID=UPI001FFDAEC6|nr:hypothetical protein [Halovivax limisalsi]
MTQAQPQPTIELAARTDLDESERHRLLSSERRRRVLAILSNRTAPISCSALANLLAVAEHGRADPPDEALRTVRISLHHCHLPVMDELGVVDYDPTTTLVESRSL